MTDLLSLSDANVVLPEHLVGLADDEWALWRDVCLRGAGFPVSQLLDLAAPACALRADQLLACQERCQQARDEALQAMARALLPTSNFEVWQCRRMTDAVRLIRKMRLPSPCEVNEEIDRLVEMYCQTRQELAHAQDEFTLSFAQETLRLEHTFHQFAGDNRLREAITWQNRLALQQGVDVLLRHPPGIPYSGAARRRHQTLLANYLQRYCAKNDSIGFFGPFGWASIVSEGPALVAQPGPALVATRTVYFEGWCIDALAEVLSRQPEARPWMVPSLLPHLRLAGNQLVLPFAPPVTLTRPQLAVLSLCKGQWTAEEIARELLARPQSDFGSAAEVYALLEQLNESRRIKWAFEISPEGSHPERGLRRVLERIGNETLRRTCLEQLAQLEQARALVVRATGDADALSQALASLEETFVQLTGVDSTRSAGKTYAARTLVYEDCRRDAQVALGPDFVQALDQPLRLLLISARWFTYQTSLFFRRAFLDAYRELLEPGKNEVDFASFWLWLHPLLLEDNNPLVSAILPTFQQLWEEVLPFDEAAHRVNYSSQAVLPRLAQAFDAPGPGWKAACYHAPDLLIKAADTQAVQQGNYQIVLGEFHMAMNTLQISACLAQHPEPEHLLHCIEEDLPEPRILPIFSRKAFPLPRIRPALISARDMRLIYAADVCAEPEARAFSIGELVVEESDGKLFVASRDKTFQCDIIEVFAEFLTRSIYTLFKPFPARQHMPRITIDRLVLMRETWCFAPASIAFAHEKDAEKRFLASRQWVQEHQLPRFAFVKVPGEQKPCFVDFASPISLDIFARLVRQNLNTGDETLSIVLSEMLPGPEASWLQDAAGEHYTSELRFIAVDLLLPPA